MVAADSTAEAGGKKIVGSLSCENERPGLAARAFLFFAEAEKRRQRAGAGSTVVRGKT
jgi:hypothetical protein